MFTLGSTILAIFTSCILYFLYKCFLHPYLLIQYYKKQGGVGLFHWQLLSIFKHYKNARKHQDFYYLYKEAFRKNPEAKFLVENFGSRPLIALMDPEMVKQFLQRHDIYQRHTDAVQYYLELLHGSMVFEEKEQWKKQRKIISSAFNFEFIKDMVPMIVDVTQGQIDSLVQAKDLKKVRIFDRAARITGDVTGRSFFGRRFDQERYNGEPLTTTVIDISFAMFNEAFDIFSIIFGSGFPKTNILPRHKKLNKTIYDMRALYERLLKEIKENGRKENNLINKLLDLQASGEENALSDEQIVGEFIGIFGAGTDTTANLVAASVYFLCRNPEAYTKVKEEVEREFKDPKSLTIDGLNSMNYTTAFLKEVLRFLAGCLLYREAVQDDVLGGVKIKKGTLFNVFLNVIHMSENYYSEPTKFKPERWLLNTPESQDPFKKEPYAYLPFSAGPRNCIGQHLAMPEAKVIIGMLIKTFNFRIPDDYNLTLVQGTVFEPMEPLLVDLEVKN